MLHTAVSDSCLLLYLNLLIYLFITCFCIWLSCVVPRRKASLAPGREGRPQVDRMVDRAAWEHAWL